MSLIHGLCEAFCELCSCQCPMCSSEQPGLPFTGGSAVGTGPASPELLQPGHKHIVGLESSIAGCLRAALCGSGCLWLWGGRALMSSWLNGTPGVAVQLACPGTAGAGGEWLHRPGSRCPGLTSSVLLPGGTSALSGVVCFLL